jgi:hypothetical protein
MEAYGGVDVQLHALLNSGPSVVTGELHFPTALSRSKSPRYPLNKMLGGHHTQYKRSSHCPCREMNSARPACSQALETQPARSFVTLHLPNFPVLWEI